MKRKIAVRGVAVFLSLSMSLGLLPFQAFAAERDNYFDIISTKEYAVSPGVKESTVTLNDDSGQNQNIGHVMEVDLSNPDVTLLSGYKDMDPTVWGTQTTSDQAAAAEEKLGVNVVGAINTNLAWNSNEPIGRLVINGQVYHDKDHSYDYFVLNKDGTAELRHGDEKLTGNEYQATSTFGPLVENGVSLYPDEDHSNSNRAPRTALGIKADGSVVMFVVDGRQAPYSVGMTMYELAETMIGLGCVDAANCDGGGSSTFISEREGSGELKVQNTPSDGTERPTLGTLMVVSKAKPTGVFDHAVLEPLNELYTPGSTVQFTAQGVDSAGSAVALPEGLCWRLAEDSRELGKIDEKTGLFTGAEDAVGKVTVELVNGDEVVGSTFINLVIPDKLSFPSEEVSLGFSETTDFGLTASYNNLSVNYKDGDFIWTQSDERLGVFDGNQFTTSDGETLNGVITVQSKHNPSVTASLRIVVGMLPVVVWDFEDVTDPDTGTVTPAEEYYTIDQQDENGEQTGMFYTSNYGKGGKQSAEIVSIDDNEPVRMGSHSLKLNYDFTNCGDVTEGACIGLTQQETIPGNPTAIGVWVYAPEGTGILWDGDGTPSGLWLRGYYTDSTGSLCQYDFTFEPKSFGPDESTWPDKYPGIWWEGWKYCEAELNGNAPYSLNSGMALRLMFVHSTGMGERTSGSIYFDNFQFVYGTNIDDVDAPQVDSIKVMTDGEYDFTDGMTIDSNTMGFTISYQDVENKYTSGIDPTTSRIYIDGINLCEDEYYDTLVSADGRVEVRGLTLLNGWHTITAYVKDKAGNEVRETYRFYVDGEDLKAPTVDVSARESSAVLGGEVNLDLTVSDPSKVESYEMGIKLNSKYPSYTISFENGYEGSYQYNKLLKTVIINAKRTSENAGNTVATITVDVPNTLHEGDVFTYSVDSGCYKTGDEQYTYSKQESELPVDCTYQLSANPVLVGEEAVIHLQSSTGEVAGVGIYKEDNTLLGMTDESGYLRTGELSKAAGDYNIYAKDQLGRLSFLYKVSCYAAQGDANGMPYGIQNNISTDGSDGKSISWLTHPDAPEQVLEYKLSDAEEWIKVQPESERLTFTSDGNSMTSVHRVSLSGLTSGTYVYRVGSEGLWSQEYNFTVKGDDRKTDFFILADIQTEDLADIRKSLEKIRAQNYDFGIQTGDAVDDAASYQDWQSILNLLGTDSLDDTDMLHVLGNHEFSGDASGATSTAIYDLPVEGFGGCYSVVYDDVYIAVINYTANRKQLQDALEWLKTDAANHQESWKLLVMHQPPYYTNPTGGNQEINELVPPVVESLGFDFVFSGHDHSYARTQPMLNGSVNEDGVVYFVCGSTGEKSYSTVNNPDFHFDVVTQDYDSVYLSLSATPNEMTVTAYNIDAAGNVSTLDTYTKSKGLCPDGEHEYIYDRATDRLECSICGEECLAKESRYSGWAIDSVTDRALYFAGGTAVVGDIKLNDGLLHYFDENGLALTGELQICNETCTFDKGAFIKSNNNNVRLAGYVGTNVQWVLYQDGSLKLSGSGDMKDYTNHGGAPWSEYRHDITSIEIGKDITSIGVYAFFGATNCESVTFEEGSKVTDIGGSAFYYLSNLREIQLPDGVKTIGNYAFGYDSKLEKVYLPDGVSSINDTAFNYCDLDLLILNVLEDSYAEDYARRKGIQYETRKPGQAPIQSGTCGENITWEMYADGLLKLTGSGDMMDYKNYRDTPWYNFRHDIKAIEIGKDITSIGVYAFFGATNCERVTFEDGSKLTDIGGNAFYYLSSLKEITLPDHVTSIGNYSFGYDTKLERVYLPEGISFINDTAFNSCDWGRLVLQVLEDSYAEQYAIDKGILYETYSKPTSSGMCGENVEWAFYENGLLKLTGSGDMTDYKNYRDTPWYSFRHDIKSIEIGKNITSIGVYAFFGATECESVIFETGSQLTDIGGSAFYYFSSLKEITIPDTVRTIGNYAFGYATQLEKVYIPDRMYAINDTAFNSCDWNKLVLNVLAGSKAEEYAQQKGIRYESREPLPEPIYDGTCGENVEWALYDGGVLKLTGWGRMSDYKNYRDTPWYDFRYDIKAIEIGKDITSIGVYAFFGAINCESVTFESGSKLTSVGGSAFYYLSSLKEITLPDAVRTIGNAAFGYCGQLEKIYLPDYVNAINDTAFLSCDHSKLVLNVAPGSYAEQYAQNNGFQYTVREA